VQPAATTRGGTIGGLGGTDPPSGWYFTLGAKGMLYFSCALTLDLCYDVWKLNSIGYLPLP